LNKYAIYLGQRPFCSKVFVRTQTYIQTDRHTIVNS